MMQLHPGDGVAEGVLHQLERSSTSSAASVWGALRTSSTRTARRPLTYYAFPDCHWIKIRTNNPLERIMREIRRRTRVVGAFPDGQSCLNLAAARLRHIAGTQWSTRKYMNMAPLHAAKNEAYGAVFA